MKKWVVDFQKLPANFAKSVVENWKSPVNSRKLAAGNIFLVLNLEKWVGEIQIRFNDFAFRWLKKSNLPGKKEKLPVKNLDLQVNKSFSVMIKGDLLMI